MYFVMVRSVATEENPCFAGDVQVVVIGKGSKIVAMSGSHSDNTYSRIKFNGYWAKDYGYKSEAMAKRSYDYRNPENTKYWKSTASIVWIDC